MRELFIAVNAVYGLVVLLILVPHKDHVPLLEIVPLSIAGLWFGGCFGAIVYKFLFSPPVYGAREKQE